MVSRRCSEETHRSSVSLVANQMIIQSDAVDLPWIEQEWRRKIALRQARLEQALSDFSGPVAEIDFDRLGADWEEEMSAVYATLGLELNDSALAAMRREMQGNESGAHGAHAAQLERFANARKESAQL